MSEKNIPGAEDELEPVSKEELDEVSGGADWFGNGSGWAPGSSTNGQGRPPGGHNSNGQGRPPGGHSNEQGQGWGRPRGWR